MEKAPYTIMVTNEGMGKGELELQRNLAFKYFTLLNESGYLPSVIAFYTDGVRLLVEGAAALEPLKVLEAKGVRLIACGTCLDSYGLRESLAVGIVGGMTDIIEAQWRAEKVITL